MRIKALIAAMMLSVMAMNANVYELPVTKVDGKEYYYYEVQPKETLYSLSHKLQVSQDEMIKYNPSLTEGLKAGTTLYFPVEALGRADVTISHKVEKGETVYGISKKYHISIEQLLQLNPSANEGIKVGDVLTIKPVASATETLVSSTDNGGLHTIASGETLYSIAVKYKTTVDDLLALNTGLSVEKYNVGTVIRVNPLAPIVNLPQSLITSIAVGNEQQAANIESEVINIAILMPFMLNESHMDKKTRVNLDFYKGFILAADSLNSAGAKIKVYAYDTYNSSDSVNMILSRPEMAQMNVIITPPGAKDVVAQVAQATDTLTAYTFNVFYANDTIHNTHPHVIQGNIVRENMYDKVAEILVAQYGDYTPVIIGSPADRSRADVVEVIKKRFADNGKESIEITFNKKLTASDLSQLDKAGKYLFIPISKSEKEFAKYTAALKTYIDQVASGNAVLFGYPEWTVYKGDRLKMLHSLGAVIYSRFYYDEQAQRSKEFEAKYAAAFKGDMAKSTPIQAALGFDTGIYLIEALRKGNGDPVAGQYRYDGLQYGFDFSTPTAIAGAENKVLYFIHFNSDGTIDRMMY